MPGAHSVLPPGSPFPRQKEGKPESRSVFSFLHLSCWVVWGVLLLLLFLVGVLGEVGEVVGGSGEAFYP